jgi:1-acyl-sn-glycerol-3-phosphate acyltransferase
LYYFVGYILKGLFNILVGIKVYNKEHLPQSGAYVLACTHTGLIKKLLRKQAIKRHEQRKY